MIYTDIGGPYKTFEFAIQPAINLGLAKKITDRINLRGTLGYQRVSGHNFPSTSNIALQWGANNQSYAFDGNAFTLDIMPEIYLSSFRSHIERPKYNAYGGIGLGLTVIPSTQYFANSDESFKKNSTGASFHLPFRLGGMMALNPLWDIGFEGSLIVLIKDDLDGNGGFNKFNDMMLQGQFFVKRYLSPIPFWKKQ
ncbi:hypothetical protein GCM10028791_07090 [Echinicola sediminis]